VERGGEQRGGEQLAADGEQVVDGAAEPGGRGALDLEVHEIQALDHGLLRPLGEVVAGGLLDMGGEHLEAGVGVDASGADGADDLVPLEGEAGGVGEQMAHGRTLGAGRLVEIDESALDRDEHGEGGDRLGDAREVEDLPGVPLDVEIAPRVGHAQAVGEVEVDGDPGHGRGLHAPHYGTRSRHRPGAGCRPRPVLRPRVGCHPRRRPASARTALAQAPTAVHDLAGPPTRRSDRNRVSPDSSPCLHRYRTSTHDTPARPFFLLFTLP
jgi:hypothetical protein